MFDRWYAATLQEKLSRRYVHLIFGARQTGKSTLLRAMLPPETLVFDLADPQERTRHLADAGCLCPGMPGAARDQEGAVRLRGRGAIRAVDLRRGAAPV